MDPIANAIEEIREQGYAVIPDFLGPGQLAAVTEAMAEIEAESGFGENEYRGYRTKRAFNLLGRTRGFDEIVTDERILGLVEGVLGHARMQDDGRRVVVDGGGRETGCTERGHAQEAVDGAVEHEGLVGEVEQARIDGDRPHPHLALVQREPGMTVFGIVGHVDGVCAGVDEAHALRAVEGDTHREVILDGLSQQHGIISAGRDQQAEDEGT